MATKNLSQLIGGVVKSIQRGTAVIGSGAFSVSQTISAVDLAKSFLSYGGSNTTDSATGLTTSRLSAATTVFTTKGENTGLSTATWEVIEYE